MAIDYWKLVTEFKVGDRVQRFAPASGSAISPFMGVVTAVQRGLGTLDVQWPYGNEQMFPDDVFRVNPQLGGVLPPEFDQTYMTGETEKARKRWASSNRNLWATTEVPAGFYRDLSQLWSQGHGEVSAYDQLWRKHAGQTSNEDSIRTEVTKFYQVASRLGDLRLQQFVAKSASYWVTQNRPHKLTASEVEAGAPSCPKCSSTMRQTSHKMHEGSSHKLYACPQDLSLIKAADLIGPEGHSVHW